MTPLEQLTMLLDLSPKIRDAGITHLRLDGIEATFAPAQPVAPTVDTKPDDEDEDSPLADPALYGLKPGAKPPGFERPGQRASAQRGDEE